MRSRLPNPKSRHSFSFSCRRLSLSYTLRQFLCLCVNAKQKCLSPFSECKYNCRRWMRVIIDRHCSIAIARQIASHITYACRHVGIYLNVHTYTSDTKITVCQHNISIHTHICMHIFVHYEQRDRPKSDRSQSAIAKFLGCARRVVHVSRGITFELRSSSSSLVVPAAVQIG